MKVFMQMRSASCHKFVVADEADRALAEFC
jgi:hypothetical protein